MRPKGQLNSNRSRSAPMPELPHVQLLSSRAQARRRQGVSRDIKGAERYPLLARPLLYRGGLRQLSGPSDPCDDGRDEGRLRLENFLVVVGVVGRGGVVPPSCRVLSDLRPEAVFRLAALNHSSICESSGCFSSAVAVIDRTRSTKSQ